jgi:hypothetical protein
MNGFNYFNMQGAGLRAVLWFEYTEMSPQRDHVLKTWFPMQYTEVGLPGGDRIVRVLT